MEPWQKLDDAAANDARDVLRACCGSSRWVERMLGHRPFGSQSALCSTAREEWFALDANDWREAFSNHPNIGDRESLARRFPTTHRFSEREQAGAAGASNDVLDALADGNRMYEEKFGYIFIVCATGRSAEEMLSMLRERLNNDPQQEILIAAEEQARITELRLSGI
jgi:2-oxo-4-hydroxy-4-carboxy-5-ureidoimidazoline decarboxylase